MRRLRAAVGPIALAVFAAGCGAESASPGNTTPPDVAAARGPTVVGAGGCASRGCHGGSPTTEDGSFKPRSRNAYTIWSRHDRHASAHHALESRLASDMIVRLQAGRAESLWNNATNEPRCLACHVTPALAASPSALHAEGVSCDACHTVPGRSTDEWFTPHKKGSPDELAECYATKGMRRLGSASERVETCVGCHVGAPAANGVPVREVTHDLIAAGHPRLNFEYLTYLRMLPPHWHEKSAIPDGPAAWYDGQVAVARAGQALIGGRPANAGPELADWNCYTCHHDLAPPGGERPQYKLREYIGRPSDPLAQVMRGRAADKPPFGANDSVAGRALIAALRLPERKATGELDRLTWDDAAQTYYALRAANRTDLSKDLDNLADLLRLPRSPAVVNSPVNYDPKAVARMFADIAEKARK